MNDWLVIGISGVTCSGKTSLADELHTKLNNSIIINQDDYFLPMDSPKHTFIPELNYINFDIMSSLDMARMYKDVSDVINGTGDEPKNGINSNGKSSRRKVLIIDGFLIFSYKPIYDLCHLKYFITLSKEICWERRKLRTYEPPDVPGYFDKIVWPEYLKHEAEITNDSNLKKIKFFDGSKPKQDIFDDVYSEIESLIFSESNQV